MHTCINDLQQKLEKRGVITTSGKPSKTLVYQISRDKAHEGCLGSTN